MLKHKIEEDEKQVEDEKMEKFKKRGLDLAAQMQMQQ